MKRTIVLKVCRDAALHEEGSVVDERQSRSCEREDVSVPMNPFPPSPCQAEPKEREPLSELLA